MSFKKKPKPINPDDVDPSIYLYDEIYDEIKDDESRTQSSEEKIIQKPKGSKYIDGLKETAERRKVDNELRRYKKFARDRIQAEENPSEQVYITASYQRKIDDMKIIEVSLREKTDSEKDRSMNFMKKATNSSMKSSGSNNPKDTTTENNQKDNPRIDNNSETISSVPASIHNTAPTPESKKSQIDENHHKSKRHGKIPRTFEDRRQLLRQILAKRTVGNVYLEAVKRYQDRKNSAGTFREAGCSRRDTRTGR